MNRRNLLKTIAITSGAGVLLPNWAAAWNTKNWNHAGIFNEFESKMITEIACTFIPEGEIPGAKTLEVDKFLNRLFSDCYAVSDQQKIKNGINDLAKNAQETYNMPFEKCIKSQKESLLGAFSSHTNEDKKWFFSTLKNETIRGYTTSEYVMLNHYKYAVAPGFYHGCVNV